MAMLPILISNLKRQPSRPAILFERTGKAKRRRRFLHHRFSQPGLLPKIRNLKSAVERTAHPHPRLFHHVRVNHRRRYILVTE